MTAKDIVFIGHFALDTIIIKEPYSKSNSLGGGVTYGSLAAAHYNPTAQIGIVSKVGQDLTQDYLAPLASKDIDLSQIHRTAEKSTKYCLYYKDGGRTLRLEAKAPQIDLEDIPPEWLQSSAVHLTPIANEYTPRLLSNLFNNGTRVKPVLGLDVQGLIRNFDSEGRIEYGASAEMQAQIFDMLQTYGPNMFIKGSEEEMCAVAGKETPKEATEYLHSLGGHILTTFGGGGLLYAHPDEGLVKLPAYKPAICQDETGAGDCFMAVLLLRLGKIPPDERNYQTIIDQIKIASAAASFLIEEKGPCGFKDAATIRERVDHGEKLNVKEI